MQQVEIYGNNPDTPASSGIAKNAHIDQNMSARLVQALTADSEQLFSIMQEADEDVLIAALRNPLIDHNHLRALLGRRGLGCLLYTSPSPRDGLLSRMPSSA